MSAVRLHPGFTAALGATFLSACATFSPDGGMGPVALYARDEIGAETIKITSAENGVQARARVQQLLAGQLTADAAVQIALLNNHGLQAEYNTLGISEADFVEATLPPINPSVTIERAFTEFEFSIERALAVSLVQLATYGKRRSVAELEFKAAQLRAVEATFMTAAETRRAFYRAVAARQRVTFLTRAQSAAEIAADLTRKQGQTGAQTKLVQARTSVFYTEVSAELAQARLAAERDREELIRQMGLWGADTTFKMPDALGNLPAIRIQGDVEREAVVKRVDILAARRELEATALAFGVTQATRYVSLLDLTARDTTSWTREEGELEVENSHGLELEVEIPIFDFGETASRRARETYQRALNELIELAVNARSEAREAYFSYRASHDIAVLYQNKIVPLRNTIDEQTLLEYNGMLIDVFDLLVSARESIDSNIAAIEAKRDFFLSEVDLQTAVIGGGAARAVGETAEASPESAAGGH